MKTYLKHLLLFCVVISVLIFSVWVYFILFSQSAWRVQWEHGVRLPASASRIECRGDAWRLFLDRSALSRFEIDSDEKDAFVQQLLSRRQIDREGYSANGLLVPGNDGIQYHYRRWVEPSPLLQRGMCESDTGDWLYWEVRLGLSKKIVIILYTDWN